MFLMPISFYRAHCSSHKLRVLLCRLVKILKDYITKRPIFISLLLLLCHFNSDRLILERKVISKASHNGVERPLPADYKALKINKSSPLKIFLSSCIVTNLYSLNLAVGKPSL